MSRPRLAVLRDVTVTPTRTAGGEDAYVVAPAESFEGNLIEMARELREYRAAPWWSEDQKP